MKNSGDFSKRVIISTEDKYEKVYVCVEKQVKQKEFICKVFAPAAASAIYEATVKNPQRNSYFLRDFC